MRLFKKSKRRDQGLTLAEVMISLVIASVTTIAFMSSIIYLIAQSKQNKQQFEALQIASYYQSLTRAADFAKLGEPGLPTNSFEAQFNFRENSPLLVRSDPQFTRQATTCRVYYQVTGWGRVSTASGTSINVTTFPSTQSAWTPDEWSGSYISFVAGRGVGQIMRISGNTANQLNLTADLSGATTAPFTVTPDSTTDYFINNGKTVRVIVSWGNGSSFRTITRTLLRPRQ